METPYEGHVRALRADSQFMGAEDLLGVRDDTPFQIVGVFRDSSLSIGGGKPKDSFYLKLRDKAGRECAKKLLINSHRRKMLGTMYGGTTADWKGMWFWVYVDEVRSPTGGTTLGIRIRNRKDAPKPTGTRQPVTPDAPPPPVSEDHPTLTEDEKAAAAFDREVPQ